MHSLRRTVVRQIILFLFIVLSITKVAAQKKLFKEWLNPSFRVLRIDSDQISKITLLAQPIDNITISAKMEGETFDNSIITIVTTKNTLSIGTDFTPFFEPYNDKLSAHKVLAIEMIVIVPESLMVRIHSSLANVYGSGRFNKLETELDSGFVELESVEGNAILFSKWGSIKVEAFSSVSGTAKSVYGTVTNLLSHDGIYQIDATSSHGSIVLSQTKK